MAIEETMVEQNDNVSADDTLEEDIVEEQDESESVESFLSEEETQPAAEEPKKTEPQGSSEPGWFKKRWDKEVGKLSTQIRNEVRAEYEGMLAPLRERLLEVDAQELVRKGEVKNLEIAKELVRARQGQPAPAPVSQGEQPRQPNGQFAPKESQETSPSDNAHLKMLKGQVRRIEASYGKEVGEAVINEFMNNEEIKQKVVAGDMDFYEVAELLKEQKATKRRPPSPTRSPNGVSGNETSSIATMTREQFEKFEKSLDAGKRYRV